jgi:hypothetical protein
MQEIEKSDKCFHGLELKLQISFLLSLAIYHAKLFIIKQKAVKNLAFNV